MLYPISVLSRSFALLALLCLAGCYPNGSQEVRNDNYEKPPEGDHALRQLLGVRTLRAEFEMPEDQKTLRVGLIYIEAGQVTASEWLSGDGLHTFHFDGKREYAKTLFVEFMVGKFDGEWKERLHVTPSFTTVSREANADFWDKFESTDLRSRGSSNQMQYESFGDFRVLAAYYGAKENVASGPVEGLLRNMDFLALLVVDFLPGELDPSGGPMVYPTEQQLQEVIAAKVGGER